MHSSNLIQNKNGTDAVTCNKDVSKQGITIGTADDMWKALANGNFTADADTIAQQKKIFQKTVTGVSTRHQTDF